MYLRDSLLSGNQRLYIRNIKNIVKKTQNKTLEKSLLVKLFI